MYLNGIHQTWRLANMDGLMAKPADCPGAAWRGKVWHTFGIFNADLNFYHEPHAGPTCLFLKGSPC